MHQCSISANSSELAPCSQGPCIALIMLRSSRNESVHALQLANKVQDKAESQKGEKEEAFKKYKVTAT